MHLAWSCTNSRRAVVHRFRAFSIITRHVYCHELKLVVIVFFSTGISARVEKVIFMSSALLRFRFRPEKLLTCPN